MGLSRTRTFYLVITLTLAVLALRPVPRAERALDWALLPARVLVELAAPVGWVRGRETLAAEGELARSMKREERAHGELEGAILDSARPKDVQLDPEQVGSVRAEVVGHTARQLDHIRIVMRDFSGLQVGMPVVSGDHYVGQIVRIPDPDDPRCADLVRTGELEVQLITGSAARVCARISSGGAQDLCQLVVGGVAKPQAPIYLDVHYPSKRRVLNGLVQVDEPRGESPYSYLANGFRLGELGEVSYSRAKGEPGQALCIDPGLIYDSGLNQVFVLFPAGLRPDEDYASGSALKDGNWAPARLFLRSEPSSWRDGRKLAMGRSRGVQVGAAIASGARLVGRVARAGWLVSDVQLTGDPGFSLPAIAMVERKGQGRVPLVLGRLRGRGRDRRGELLFEWQAAKQESAALPATIWSGSGDAGLPRGLLLGQAELPPGPGPHLLRIRRPEGVDDPRQLLVRLEPQEEGTR